MIVIRSGTIRALGATSLLIVLAWLGSAPALASASCERSMHREISRAHLSAVFRREPGREHGSLNIPWFAIYDRQGLQFFDISAGTMAVRAEAFLAGAVEAPSPLPAVPPRWAWRESLDEGPMIDAEADRLVVFLTLPQRCKPCEQAERDLAEVFAALCLDPRTWVLRYRLDPTPPGQPGRPLPWFNSAPTD